MKIKVKVEKIEEIDLIMDFENKVCRLPTKPRIEHRLKTICKHCLKSITDEYFIAIIVTPYGNLMFHESCCTQDVLTFIK